MTDYRPESSRSASCIEAHERASDSRAALRGLLIAEYGQRIGVAVCGSLLAQLGATVVTVEHPSSPGKWTFRDQFSAGKLSILATDFAGLSPQRLGAFDVVLLSSDISHYPGVLSATQIVCDVTALGADRTDDNLTDAEIQALTGIVATTGVPNEAPRPVPFPLVEYLAGINAASAVIAAHIERRRSKLGQRADVTLYDCGFLATSSFLARLLAPSPQGEICSMGNRHGLSSPWNVYRARDGWVQICTGSDEQWQRLCEAMNRPELADDPRYARTTARVAANDDVDAIVQNWISGLSIKDCIETLTKNGIAGGEIAPITDYPVEDNLRFRDMVEKLTSADSHGRAKYTPGSPLRMSETPGLALTQTSAVGADLTKIHNLLKDRIIVEPQTAARDGRSLPLEGIRVVEIGHYTTAPAAARYLAALGADVIKVEAPEGEASRKWPPSDRGQSLFYTLTNSGKRSLVLDLANDADRKTLHKLLATTDVLIENLTPGALAKRGFSFAEIHQRNPGLIYCAISGFGAHSLYPGRPAFDTVIQGMSGLMDSIRSDDDVPLKTGISSADVFGAALSVVAILAALEHRANAGSGQFIDLSMQDIMAWSTQIGWNNRDLGPTAKLRKCSDGYVLYDGNAEPADFERATRAQAVVLARNYGHRVVPVLSPNEALVTELTQSRRLCVKLNDERGSWPALGLPVQLSATPLRVDRPSPALGRNNVEIRAELDRGTVSASHPSRKKCHELH
jgi:crotonobetainyl-CoA:carnitine CoA-transferase CaiB-like acyl-CoA transferase